MYEEFKILYFNMKDEMLDTAKARRVVLTALSKSETGVQHCINWLELIRESPTYIQAKQRCRELDPDRLAYYKSHNMKHFPEVAYRKAALKELRQLWDATMPEILKRKKYEKKISK